MVLLKIRLISSFSASVILSNVIGLVCQDFINPQCFLHKVSQLSGVFNDFFQCGASLQKEAEMTGR